MSLTSLLRVASYCSVVVWGSILMDSQIVFKELSFIVKHTEVNSRRRYQSGFYKGTLVQCAGNTSKRALEMHKYLIILWQVYSFEMERLAQKRLKKHGRINSLVENLSIRFKWFHTMKYTVKINLDSLTSNLSLDTIAQYKQQWLCNSSTLPKLRHVYSVRYKANCSFLDNCEQGTGTGP